MELEKGKFQSFRVVVEKISVGAIDGYLTQNEIVEYDGFNLKQGEKSVNVPSLSSAIKVGWLVPANSSVRSAAPVTAGVKIHKADGSGREITYKNVESEERQVHTVEQTRIKRLAGNAPKRDSESESEGVVVSRVKTPTNFGKVEVGKDDHAIIRNIENSGLKVERLANAKSHSGDVSEAMAGDELEDILPDAASSGTPILKKAKVEVVEETTPAAPTETVSEGQIRTAKVEVIKQFYKDSNYEANAPWRTRAKVLLEEYSASGDKARLDMFLSAETQAVLDVVQKKIS